MSEQEISVGKGRPRGRRSSTMADIARIANVSTKTVSLALHYDTSVRQKTAARVLEAANILNYNLEKGVHPTGLLGIVLPPDIAYSPSGRVVNAILEHAAIEGFGIRVAGNLGYPGHDVSAMQQFDSERVRAIILIEPNTSLRVLQQHISPNRPLIVIHGDFGEAKANFISVDIDDQGPRKAAGYLQQNGHQHFTYLQGPLSPRSIAQRDLYGRIAEEFGLETSTVYSHGKGPDHGYEITKGYLLALQHLPTAIIAESDRLASGVLRALFEAGIRVPEDVSLIGSGGSEVASTTIPSLSTIAYDISEMEASSFGLLVNHIKQGVDLPRTARVQSHFLVRESAGNARTNEMFKQQGKK